MKQYLPVVGVIIVIIGAIFFLESRKAVRVLVNQQESSISPPPSSFSLAAVTAEKQKKFPFAREISTPDGFVNTDAITISSLIGKKVILVDFWTYSCINCQRTTPYLNSWYEKYKDKGLEIIGLHTPEFEFEKKYENVTKAVSRLGIKFPVVLDNDYSTWTAYENHYWPRKYLIDIDGYVIYDHIGEGGYEETEEHIQGALMEAMERMSVKGTLASDFVKPADVQMANKNISPEIYFGSARNKLLANGKSGVVGEQVFENEPRPPYADARTDAVYMAGKWELKPEYVVPREQGARVIFRYHAGEVYFVASAKSPQKIRVLRDGVAIGENGGVDVVNGTDGASTISISADQLYHVVSEKGGYGEHVLELIFDEPEDIKLYTFTFG